MLPTTAKHPRVTVPPAMVNPTEPADLAEAALLGPAELFADRHIGPGDDEIGVMLEEVGCDSLDAFSDAVVPAAIRLGRPLKIEAARSEFDLLAEMRCIAGRNTINRSFIGMGYHGCITPPVIQRNILENPGWYTQYTPYQAEISQGRLEALLNFQTLIADLTGLPLRAAIKVWKLSRASSRPWEISA